MKIKSKGEIAPFEFENNLELTDAVLPDTVRCVGEYAFCGCKELKSITLPDGITKIGANAFFDCEKLKFHTDENCSYLGNGENPCLALIELISEEIKDGKLIIPEGVRVIADSAFYLFTLMKCVVLPRSLVSICAGAFYGCENLTDVYYSGSEDEWKRVSVDRLNDCLLKAKLHFNYHS